MEQQLTFSSDIVGGETLGLMHAVKDLYGKEDCQLSYHFLHLILQEFFSAYHITQLPSEKQEQVIREHIMMNHLNIVVRFYFGLTEPNIFTAILQSEEILEVSDATAYHWLFEAGDMETEALETEKKVAVQSSYAWSPLDYYVLGHSIAHHQYQWSLYFNGASMGDEEMEMLCKGMASCAKTTWKGEITTAYFSYNNITLDEMMWFVTIPLQILQQIKELHLASTKLDRSALNIFSEVIAQLTKLQTLSLFDNPIGKGGAVEVFKHLHKYNTPLKELDLRKTEVGEEDGQHLALLISGNRHLETLRISCGILPSILKYSSPYSTLQTLDISFSPLSMEDIVSLSLILQQSLWQLKKLNISKCDITSEGATQLAMGLTVNKTLAVLWMSNNQIGVEGAKALSEVIKENTTLQKLYLSGDNSLEEGADTIISSLDMNVDLEYLSLSATYECQSNPRIWWFL